jgi:hypothetical protein
MTPSAKVPPAPGKPKATAAVRVAHAPTSFKTLAHMVGGDEALASLVPQARKLAALRQDFQSLLPASLAKACSPMSWRGGVLKVHAANPAVAAKLKQLMPSVTAQLQDKGWQITETALRVQPLEEAESKGISKIGALKPASSERFRAVAERLSDSPLKEVLKRF